ncbi:unnamed protein product [Leuciscus chuanchicus]
MTVADEIFDSVKDSIIEYEKEIERLKQENCSLRSRNCSCAETCHDTPRDGCLQGQTGSELSEIRVKLEVANVMSHEPLSQASPLSEAVTGQEHHECLSLLPEVMPKNEDTQSSITVKSELCDNQASESNSSAVQSGSNCHVELKLAEQEPSSLQLELETFDEVLQKARRKHQSALCKICSKSFRNNGHLRKHMLVHQKERPFCCGSCVRRFKTKSSLKEHERLHAEGQAEDRSVEPLDSQLSHVEIILQPDSRMTAVAEEIFDAVKDNVIEYEQEIERLKQENCCLRSTLTHSRNSVCAETRHDTRRDGCLQVPLGSELSEIQVKMEVATVMPHEPLRQASTNTSPLSEGFKWQEPSHCLTFLPNVLSKNEDIGVREL